MIKINLIENQIPTEIDIPRKKKNYRYVFIFFTVSISVLILSVAGVYFLFVKTAEHKLNVVKNKEVVKHEEIGILTKKHHLTERKEKVESKKVEINSKEDIAIAEKELDKAKKGDSAVFSFEIQLENIPLNKKKDNKSIVLEDVLKNMEKDNKTANKKLDNKSVAKIADIAKKKNASNNTQSKQSIKITTSYPKKLKVVLRRMGIKYKVLKTKAKKTISYDILVGGFDSYKKLVRFAAVLKKKGYKVYDIKNLGLRFFVCIDKGVNKTKRDRYIAVWRNTPFRIVAQEKEKYLYRYVFKFKASAKEIKLLKRRGYYPIILSSKSGA